MATTQQTFQQTPPTVTTTDIKTIVHQIHTSIVSRHLATRGNDKIPPPHISSSEEFLPHLRRRTLSQLRTNKSPFLKSYLHKVDAKSHPSPLCPLCNTHTHNTHHVFNSTHKSLQRCVTRRESLTTEMLYPLKESLTKEMLHLLKESL